MKVFWVKRFFDNVDSFWQRILLENLDEYGGERVLNFQTEKIQEVALKLRNPFGKDVLYSFACAKPITKINVQDILSLDILNFVPCNELLFYDRWKSYGVRYLFDIIDPSTKDFITFCQLKDKVLSNNFMKYYSLLSRIPKSFKECIRTNLKNINFVNF